MVNKDKTITVGDLLKMLADGRVTMDMPIAVTGGDNLRGVNACEIYTWKDGKAVVIHMGELTGDLKTVEGSSELFL